jgi:hypothetical protein
VNLIFNQGFVKYVKNLSLFFIFQKASIGCVLIKWGSNPERRGENRAIDPEEE